MERISPYEAKYGKQFKVPSCWGQDLRNGSARERLATLIDASWKHSWHWPDDHNSFLDKAQENLNTELTRAKERLAELESAQKILSIIDREEPDESVKEQS